MVFLPQYQLVFLVGYLVKNFRSEKILLLLLTEIRSYSIYLLIVPLDFKSKYFHVAKEEPVLYLTFSHMQEYTIDSDWRFRSTVLTPMFIETQTSQSALQTWSQEGPLSVQGALARQIRATQQQYDFTPTQNIGKLPSACLPLVRQALLPWK